MHEAKLSSKHQIVIPRQARNALGLKAGDKVLVLRKPKDFAKSVVGLGKGLYPPDYLEAERDSWR
jgi:AbrB family looped-hinge helix DNA binding protein